MQITALGLAFKPNIDDLRESPARQIVGNLADELPQANIMAVEPSIEELPSELDARESVTLTEMNEAVRAADIVLLLVDHNEFVRLDRSLLAQKIVHDARGVALSGGTCCSAFLLRWPVALARAADITVEYLLRLTRRRIARSRGLPFAPVTGLIRTDCGDVR